MRAGLLYGDNPGICQCAEELQEEGAIKEQCRCCPCAQERPGTSNVYAQRSGLEDVVVTNDFIKDAFIPDGDAQVVSG